MDQARGEGAREQGDAFQRGATARTRPLERWRLELTRSPGDVRSAPAQTPSSGCWLPPCSAPPSRSGCGRACAGASSLRRPQHLSGARHAHPALFPPRPAPGPPGSAPPGAVEGRAQPGGWEGRGRGRRPQPLTPPAGGEGLGSLTCSQGHWAWAVGMLTVSRDPPQATGLPSPRLPCFHPGRGCLLPPPHSTSHSSLHQGRGHPAAPSWERQPEVGCPGAPAQLGGWRGRQEAGAKQHASHASGFLSLCPGAAGGVSGLAGSLWGLIWPSRVTLRAEAGRGWGVTASEPVPVPVWAGCGLAGCTCCPGTRNPVG